jgi:zinc transport system ATP-binding protein
MSSGNVHSVKREYAEEETTETRHPVVAVSDVCFKYREREVLHDVSFEIPEGALVAIIGPNGGGKTTLLKLLLGLLKPRIGEITVLGQTPEKARRRVGFVPQHIVFDQDFPITVLEAVMLGRAGSNKFGNFTRSDRSAARDALAAVGLPEFGKRLFSELSGGQRQRVLIAQALCTDPDVLLLDEPTANVDTDTEKSLYELFKKLNETKTILIVSHNLRVVIAHATHVMCVNRSVDIHVIGEDEHTRLIPVEGHSSYSVVDDSQPAHIVCDLSIPMSTPHRDEKS